MKKVLIADDNRIALEGMKRVINWEKFDCELVAFCLNGQDAWNIIEKGNIDIVVTDIEMPLMNGLQLLNKIRENNLDIKLIFMSCYEDFNFIKSAIDMDAVAYILKPIVPEQLEKALLKIINMHEKDMRIIESQNRLDNLIKNHLNVLQEQFLRSLIFSPEISDDEIHQMSKTLHIDLSSPYKLQLAIIECMPLQKNEEGIANLLDIQEFINTSDVFGLITKAYFDRNNRLFIVSIYSSDQSDHINNVYIQLDDYALKNNIKLKIGISNEAENISKLKELYSQAEQAISSSYISDKNMMILYNDIFSSSECMPDFIDPTILKKELSDLLFNQNEYNIDAFLDKFIPRNSDKIHTYYIRYFCYSTISTIEILLTSFNIDYNKAIEHSIIWDKLAHYESITNVRQWLYNILRSTLDIIYENTQKKDINVVDKIKNIIEQDYATHLTLNNISERVFFSSIHTNNLFKKETGLSVAEYLSKYRITVAKKLLEDPESKIYAVAEAVGYKNQAHFKLLFKQITGYTPLEYKNLFSCEKSE